MLNAPSSMPGRIASTGAGRFHDAGSVSSAGIWRPSKSPHRPSMEQVPVTVEEVRRILAGAPTPTVSDEDRSLVLGYREAMGFVLRQADGPTLRWDRNLILNLHDRVLGGSFALHAGRLREGAVFIVDRQSGTEIFPTTTGHADTRTSGSRAPALLRPARAPSDPERVAPRRSRRDPPLHAMATGERHGCWQVTCDVSGRLSAAGVHLARGVVGSPPARLLRGVSLPGRSLRRRHVDVDALSRDTSSGQVSQSPCTRSQRGR